jgi:hypothetical protein
MLERNEWDGSLKKLKNNSESDGVYSVIHLKENCNVKTCTCDILVDGKRLFWNV